MFAVCVRALSRSNRYASQIVGRRNSPLILLSSFSGQRPETCLSVGGDGKRSLHFRAALERVKSRKRIKVLLAFAYGCRNFAKDVWKSFNILWSDMENDGVDRSHLPRSDLKILRRVRQPTKVINMISGEKVCVASSRLSKLPTCEKECREIVHAWRSCWSQVCPSLLCDHDGQCGI